jgi:3-hydroxybutyryl-CoA dehydrogenase
MPSSKKENPFSKENRMLNQDSKIGVIGAGAMGAGIAQVAASAGHTVYLFDSRHDSAAQALEAMGKSLQKLEEKGKIGQGMGNILISRIQAVPSLDAMDDADLVIEAIVEQLPAKQEVFSKLETVVSPNCIIATNTSSLSVTAIASACKKAERVIGLHFFNPATLMPLVEVIPAVQTEEQLPAACVALMKAWKKVPVIAKDTPGFIVNRLARSFYGESIKIYEEGMADMPTIDWALKTYGGFRMGPFELMDLIGNDVNYTVTETVWTQMYFDSRYRPSLTQKKMVESKRFGRKSGRGYYNYAEGAVNTAPVEDHELGKKIFDRVIAMLINEAVDALYLRIATREELDLAMTKGVNYPKGLLAWCDEIGPKEVLRRMDELFDRFRDDRYRASVGLREL